MKPSEFFKANPNCTFEAFQAATGSSKQTWYSLRYLAKKKTKAPVVKLVKKVKMKPINEILLDKMIELIQQRDKEKIDLIRSLATKLGQATEPKVKNGTSI